MLLQLNPLTDLLHASVKSSHIQSRLQTLVQYLLQILLIDAIAAGTTFVPNSILVDGIPRPNENPITGITLNIILPNNTIIVTFQVNVVSIPSQNNMNNIAVIHYEYEPDPSLPPISETAFSNTTNIQFIDVILTATKSANTVLANIDETVAYTVFIQNNGSTTTNSIFLQIR